jgi:tRNA (guanine37-N1)-methyltransferase
VAALTFHAHQVLRRLLPPELEMPSAFETVGHIAHLNLREALLPFKYIIAQARYS